MKKMMILWAACCLLLTGPAAEGWAGTCSSATSIDSGWDIVLCPGAINERVVGKTAGHSVNASKSCETSTAPPTIGGGGGGGGGESTPIDPEMCFMPVCSSGACEDKDSNECTGSSVVLTKGAYETGDTDLKLPLRGLPLVFERTYRSNTIVPEPNFYVYVWWKPPIPPHDTIVKVPLFYGYRKPGPTIGIVFYGDEPPAPSEEPPPPVPPGSADDTEEPPKFEVPLDGPLGFGWQSELFAEIRGDGLAYYDGQGRFTDFQQFALAVQLRGVNGGITSYAQSLAGIAETDPESGLTLRGTATGYELIERSGLKRIFDRGGKLRVIEDAQGNFLNIHYDDRYRISTVDDSTETTVLTFNYADPDHRIDSMTDLHGRTVYYDYDAIGHLIQVTDWDGKVKSYTYNDYHGMLTKTNEVGETYTVTYAYPDRGIVETVVDPVGTASLNQGGSAEGHERGFLYDFKSRQFWIAKPGGNVLNKAFGVTGRLLAEYEIDTENRLIQKIEYVGDREEIHTDGGGNTKHLFRDEWRNITKIIDGEGFETRITYNPHNKPLQLTDPLGVITRFAYDETGTLLLKKTEAIGLPEQVVTDYGYNQYGELISVSVAGATTTIAYNDQGLPNRITDPLGNASRIEYDIYGQVSATVDAEGNRTEITNDAHGNPTLIKNDLGEETKLEYNAAGRLELITDPLLHITRVETDYKEHITALVDHLGNRKEFAFDGDENLRRITQLAPGDDRALDAVTLLDYDGSGRLVRLTDPEGNLTGYSYAREGCSSCGASTELPETVTDPFGEVTKNLFDKNGKLIGVQTPLDTLAGVSTDFERDAKGQITKRTDANGKITSYQYDALGRVLNQLDANIGLTQFEYDLRGNLIKLTDPENNATTFQYDLAGRKTKEIRPLGQATAYGYYKNGLLKTVRDAKGQITTYGYDKVNRLKSVTYHDQTQDLFDYDAAGNLTGWSTTGESPVSGTMVYDELNRKTGEMVNYGGFSKSFSYGYDQRGNKTGYLSPEGIAHTYEYLLNDRLKKIDFDGKILDLNYDKTRLKQIVYPSGVTTAYDYNVGGWLRGIETKKDLATLLQRDYGFDHVGNIGTMTTQAGETVYGYDDIYQLTGADHPLATGLADENYSYDRVGNRRTSSATSGSWSHNQNNELIDTTDASYEYDANGNTVKKTVGTQVTRYEYNARNRLARVILPSGQVASYSYDPYGRRVRKQVDSLVTWYVYAEEGLVGEYSAWGGMEKIYGWKPGGLWGTDPLYMVEGGSYYFYHNDHLGTPQRLTSAASGAVVWGAGYAAFGLAQIDPLSTIENNLRFPGQYFDAETSLHYNWNRTYDPGTGQYTQVDPIGFAGRDSNLYRYVLNSPIRRIDPYGLLTVGLSLGYSAYVGKTSDFDGGSMSLSTGALIYSEEKGFLPGDAYQTAGAESGTFVGPNGEKKTTFGLGLSGGPEISIFSGDLDDFKGSAVNFTASFVIVDFTWTETATGKHGLTIGTGLGFALGLFAWESDTKGWDSSQISNLINNFDSRSCEK